ncbi:BZ3500_MvSof-1268-A1-R1_Chr2-2g04801 [Microbotryum saponariae]|uniref:BZ3500_MvSof-1268-A1-R1_Chr2-2g04801 protein n=1 Tax=Microbotryum saponariae TaxID=289078 RepID=A0A2X0MZW7_9BASI|nr:BZ3500_MvSof-1268-A1-R1_Chr2-2g04801 [Microbotryum saponariae]SDA00192.1 BZ3501_MvSof-1269-A2-R1_Chr2-2g04475 [Microbotryum saponariae]
MSIRPIDHTSVHRLTSGQVIIDLQSAVKELLDNALDAGATSIQILFRNHGIELVEVQDNGQGIEEHDWASIGSSSNQHAFPLSVQPALKNHTSKLSEFNDLGTISTLGFRGEALSSLCGTADLSMITSTPSTTPIATRLTFLPSGECVVGGKAARSVGTTVMVKDLFAGLPVRRKEFERNAKRELGKALDLVQAYALVRTGVRFEVKHTLKGKTTTHLQTTISQDLRSNFSSIFSPVALNDMIELDLEFEVSAEQSARAISRGLTLDGPVQVVVRGLISKPAPGHGRSINNRSFYYVNGRPFTATKISKAVTEVYRRFNTNAFPFVVADFQMRAGKLQTRSQHSSNSSISICIRVLDVPDAYDVNVSPDKRTIFLHQEGKLIASLKNALEELFSPSQSSYPITHPQLTVSPKEMKSDRSEVQSFKQVVDLLPPMPTLPERSTFLDGVSEDEEESLPQVERPSKRSRIVEDEEDVDEEEAEVILDEDEMEVDDEPSSTQEEEVNELSLLEDDLEESPAPSLPATEPSGTLERAASEEEEYAPANSNFRGSTRRTVVKTMDLSAWVVKIKANEPNSSRPQGRTPATENGSTRMGRVDSPDQAVDSRRSDRTQSITPQVKTTQDVRAQNVVAKVDHEGVKVKSVSCPTNFSKITQAWNSARPSTSDLRPSQPAPEEPEPASFDGDKMIDLSRAGVNKNSEQAEQALSLVVTKQDFACMSIVGQFNHAFIIARRTRRSTSSGGDKTPIPLQDDLFIIDQHASDEKYNYEDLQKSTVIQSQRLIQPRTLHLLAQDELLAIEHAKTLRLNGFEVLLDEDAKVGERVKLVAQPVSGSTTFGVSDLEELLELLKGSDWSHHGHAPRPSKVQKMFASRACRKSVMFGHALNEAQSASIVRNMSQMDRPWSCPHGRPTMRWALGVRGDGRTDVGKLVGSLIK